MTALERLQRSLAGRYVIEREIGEGGMATVYLARDVRHQRKVALKVLKPELAAVLGVERFLAEIRVTASLQHPNLLPLFDSGEAGALLFYVMPFVEGETLRRRLDREKQLPIDEAVRIAVSVSSALEYAHGRGVIHRDLKPENIMVHAGQPVIADFGIALAVSNAGGARITQTGLSLGTPQYMSPEQAAGDREIDGRTDIYSLGAVTYEMLAGEPPHSGTSAQAIIAKLITTEPRPLRSLRRAVPGNVSDAVEKALAKLPADRFHSAQQFGDALTNPAYTTQRSVPDTSVNKRLRTVAYTATTLLAALVVVTAWAWLRPSASTDVHQYAFALDPDQSLAPMDWNRIAISQDGAHFAYIGGPHGQIFLLDRNQLRATPLPGTEGATSVFFSPDGKNLGFVSGNTLYTTAVHGGYPTPITDSLVGGVTGVWGDDGFIYVPGVYLPIVRVEAKAHAVPRLLTALDRGEMYQSPTQLLPDGRGLSMSVQTRTFSASFFGVADIATGRHRLFKEIPGGAYFVPPNHIVFIRNGTVMAAPFDLQNVRITGDATPIATGVTGHGNSGVTDFAVSQSGPIVFTTATPNDSKGELVWVTRDGRATPIDTTWRGAFSEPELSPDGKRLAVAVADPVTGWDVWIKELDHGPKYKLTSSGKYTGGAAWLPNGRAITYGAGPADDEQDLWTKPVDGGGKEVLQMHQDRSVVNGSWSPDGKWFVFQTWRDTPGAGDIFAMRPGIDSAPIPLVATKYSEISATLSPDGHWLAYISDETGRYEVYVVPFPNAHSGRWAISNGGGSEPRWSHREDEIFYRDGTGNLVAVTVATKPSFSVRSSKTLFPAAGFGAWVNHPQYAVSLDDQRFLMTRQLVPSMPEKLVFVENWKEKLKPNNK